jgi:hypothetical protein
MQTAPADNSCSHSGIFTCGAAALDGQPVLAGLRLPRGENFRARRARAGAGLAFEHDEAPGRELAVIGNARRQRENLRDLLLGRGRPLHQRRRRGAAFGEQVQRVVHGLLTGFQHIGRKNVAL